MVYVLFSVICSVTVSVILKLARRYEVDTTQIIVWNYPVAVLCTWVFLEPTGVSSAIAKGPLGLYGGLAVLLPGVFVALSSSIRYAGIVRTEVAQRLSLFISLVAAFWLFHESPQSGKLVGVAVGVIGILCSIGWHRGRNQHGTNYRMWMYPLTVFLGYGVIDILFKKVALHTAVPYTTSMLMVFTLEWGLHFYILLITFWWPKNAFLFTRSFGVPYWAPLILPTSCFTCGRIVHYPTIRPLSLPV